MTGWSPSWRPGPTDSITDVVGVTVGHSHRIDDDVVLATDTTPGSGWATGVTVVRPPTGSIVAVDVRGGGPGTRETDLLDPSNTVQTAHALVLSGGSAFGLCAADGVMTELASAGIGLPMNAFGDVVPIVPAAVIFDLPVGGWQQRPTPADGRAAARAASAQVARGSVGAGAAARAGVLKGGVGTASVVLDAPGATGVTVAALVVANPVGDVIDPASGLPWGSEDSELAHHRLGVPDPADVERYRQLRPKGTVLNTTIGVVAFDARLDAASTRRVAIAAHDGLALAIRPAHSPLDGDTLFAVATGGRLIEPAPGPPSGMNPDVALVAAVSAAAAVVVRRAVVDAVLCASTVAGIPTFRATLPSALR
ncbi:P1 family peptidase [Williamsia sp. CHRR-6]|uniref:P1 family peptidase n=1 Tax=Williamsia sp. CHRR-6 TaxID=2835871 RepID=UPI001BDA7CEE|nr:P1 family peptidase [Williamsia sp. CHRR-6]MBT0568246.1 P1 family peptidase [Williamsia sp. CHRR-6]